MKKFLLGLFVLFFIISVNPLNVSASSEEIALSKFNIETTIKEDGSIDMVELITYNFKKKFNGAYRDISIRNTEGIYDIKVSFISEAGQETPFRKVTDAKNGDNNVFEISKQNKDLYRLKIYSPSKNEEKTFKIAYTMKNVVTKYKDTGELFYEYWSDYNETKIDNLKIHINLPYNMENQDIKAYYHTVSSGNISVKNGTVEYTFPHINSKELVEARVLFPASSIPLSPKTRNENALDRILSEEADYREKQQQKIALALARKKTFNYVSIISVLFFLIFILIIWRKFRNNNQDVYSIYSPPELPEECTPAVAAYLVNRTATGRTIYATLLDLWRKGYLTIKKAEPENKKDKINFSINKVEKDSGELLNHERYFMNWLFDKLGNGKSVTTSSIKKANKKSPFYHDSQEWSNLIREEVKSRNYYDKKANRTGIWLIAFSIIGIIISIVSLAFGAGMGILSLLASVITMICGVYYCVKKSPKGQSRYNNWIKFIKYIKNTDFTCDLNTHYIESYIPYAEALNIKKGSMSNLTAAFHNPSQNMGWIYYYLLFDSMNLNRKEQFSYYIYDSFNTGSSGSSSSDSSSSSSGSSGGGGAGGF
ncbi:DUF2207 domain-containing protein [Clostridium kluyveri]|uniref:DUF2207 domain-containing protein n=1 Tax=Clostridium kluyveri TaxID=1534 RepID=A0A1L5F963_CLOKL|nr:DUF2207 domain-containing protein [Clostridium kluyveri]APM39568.1 hypothetical protein BS101_12860 [Clostridium kluyveri]